jgi:hypothetical protein
MAKGKWRIGKWREAKWQFFMAKWRNGNKP